jgi:hypothetical protein
MSSIEQRYSEILEEGHCTMNAEDLAAMDVHVYPMTKKQYDKMYAEWEAMGGPLFDVPLFPREEIE